MYFKLIWVDEKQQIQISSCYLLHFVHNLPQKDLSYEHTLLVHFDSSHSNITLLTISAIFSHKHDQGFKYL